MPLNRVEKTVIGAALGALLGAVAGAAVASQRPFNLPEDQTSPGFNAANLGTAIEAGLSIGTFTGAAIGLAA